MKNALLIGIAVIAVAAESIAQTATEKPTVPVWIETDRKFLLDNLIRSKDEIVAETTGLTEAQWNFKESPDRWSINQIIEHLCIWELIETNDVSVALRMGPIPDFTHYLPDSLFTFDSPEKMDKLVTTDYTSLLLTVYHWVITKAKIMSPGLPRCATNQSNSSKMKKAIFGFTTSVLELTSISVIWEFSGIPSSTCIRYDK